MRIAIICLIYFLNLSSCSGNVASGTVDKTKAQQAKEALDTFDWETAITLYLELIEEEPEKYGYYGLLASSYAGRAGVDIFSIASNKLTGSGSMISKVQKYIPENPSDEQLADMDLSLQYLQSIPLDDLIDSELEAVTTQLSVYLTINSGMLINSFSTLTPTGQLDPEQLDQMSADDADAILSSLQAAMETSQDPKFVEKLGGVLAEIEASEGGSQEEKLKSFLQAQQQQQQ